MAFIERDLSSIELRTSTGEPLVVLAARLVRQQVLDCLLQNGSDIQASDTEGIVALMHCSARGQLADVERLLQMGADPRRSDRAGLTALSLAAMSGHMEVVRTLKPRMGVVSELDWLLCAIAFDEPETLNDTVLDWKPSDSDWPVDGSPLLLAAHNGSVKVLRKLLGHGADPNSVTYLLSTPLSAAAASGRRECVGILLASGADPTHRDKFDKTARDYASERGHDEICAALAAAEQGLEST